MKFAYGSDIHLEFGIHPKGWAQTDADVLLLAGDVCEIKNRGGYTEWFDKLGRKFDEIVLIAGNHEYYNGHLKNSLEGWRKFLSERGNYRFLDNEVHQVGDVRILGATMWTDLKDPMAELEASRRMNDYRIILAGGEERLDAYGQVTPLRSLLTIDTKAEHRASKEWLKEQLEQNPGQKTIVMTHHAPHELSVTEKYRGSSLNDAYISHDLESLIEDSQIDYWIHGHTHGQIEYSLHGTKVRCNAQGYYGHEHCARDWSLKEFEL